MPGESPCAGTRYARSGDSRIAYELRGTRRWRRPWLVLNQGMGFDRHGWDPVLRNLGRHFRLVLVDNRGSGRSDLPPGSFGVAGMADDILSVLDRAGVRKWPTAWSHSRARGQGSQGLVIFLELGHLLFWEEPDRFVDAVTVFLLAERAPRKVLHARDGKH